GQEAAEGEGAENSCMNEQIEEEVVRAVGELRWFFEHQKLRREVGTEGAVEVLEADAEEGMFGDHRGDLAPEGGADLDAAKTPGGARRSAGDGGDGDEGQGNEGEACGDEGNG